MLLSLLLLLLLLGLVAYFWLNQQLATYGINQWQLSVASLSSQQVVIKKLSLTLDEPASQSATDTGDERTLQQLLNTQIPSFLPDQITINSLRLQGSRVSRIAATDSISADLSISRDQQDLALQLAIKQPAVIDLQLSRKQQQWQIQLNHGSTELSGQLSSPTGALKANLHYSLSTNDLAAYLPVTLDTLSFKRLDIRADLSAQLSDNASLAEPWQLMESLSGKFHLADGISLSHQTQLSEQGLQASLLLDPVDWQQQPKLTELLRAVYPPVIIQQGHLAAEMQVHYAWADKSWRIDNGKLSVKQANWVFNTWSATDHNATARFSADTDGIFVSQLKQHLSSLQLGFVIGPIDATMGLKLPFAEKENWQMTLQQHQVKAFGGTIQVPNKTYRLNGSFELPVVFERLSLGEVMRQYPSNKVAIDGKVSGTLPLKWHSNQLTLSQGYLNALAPGGYLSVDSSALTSAAGDNPSLQTLAGILQNFTYHSLSSEINYDDRGKLNLQLQLKGFNPDVEQGRPVEFNLTLQEDLPALIKGLQLSNSLNEIVRQRIQENINR